MTGAGFTLPMHLRQEEFLPGMSLSKVSILNDPDGMIESGTITED
jgi:hypothetical protein